MSSNRSVAKLHSKSRLDVVNKILVYAGLIIASLVVVLPFAIILITSFKSPVDAMSYDFTLIGKKDGATLQGYKELWNYVDYETGWPLVIRGFLNTMITSVVPTLVSLLVSALAAFAFSKIRFRLSNLFFSIIIFTMMIPGTILLVPHYSMYEFFGWINTFTPLIVPGLFGGAGCIFFLRQFMFGIPDSLVEAGKIDGLSWVGIFFRLIVPLIVPALLAQGLLMFIGHYNSYLGPYLYLQERKLFTLQLIVSNFNGFAAKNYPAIMSCCILTMLPVLVLYVIFQKYFVEGIATSGMKL